MNATVLAKHRILVFAILAGPVFWFIVEVIKPELNLAPRSNLTLILIFQFCLIYPIMEELVFRGGLQGLCAKYRCGRARWLNISSANLITSLIFSLLHFWSQHWGWALLVVIPSLLFGYLKEYYQSLLPSILLHSFYNAGFMIFVMR